VWAAGQRIGDYELLANLRSGGMATLFLARQLGAAGFARPVAIKVVHPELAGDEQFRQMFLDEALLSSRIQHPNVVHVEALGEHEGLHYLAMEFVHGCSLAQLTRALTARGRRLAPAFATRIAMHVADALHAAHETRDQHGRLLEVVHRDVSPENILLAYSGHVKLIDFGIAKAYGRRHKTQEGLLKGKFRYMAPEQAYGKAIDRRTDIYQLGIVLWEMLTLRKLFDADDELALLGQVRDPRVPSPGSVVDRIPAPLDHAVMQALAKNPTRRPADAQVFARTLAKAMPSAHDVDSGALSSLLLATMQEHRSREQATYPPGVYDRLEQQIDTLRIGGAPEAAGQRALQNFTVEQTSPYGSDSPPGADAIQPRRQAETQAELQSPRHDSARIRAAQSIRPLAAEKGPRQRRLVRLASELRTTITAIERRLRDQRAVWLGVGAVALAFALALLTALLRERPRRPAPVPPPAALTLAAPAPLAEPPAAAGAAEPSPSMPDASTRGAGAAPEPARAKDAAQPVAASGTSSAVEARVPSEPVVSASGNGAPASVRGATAKRLPTLGSVDGTPLFTEPGF
jgi:serine/threonine-protein kinase